MFFLLVPPRPLSAPFLFRTSRKGTDSASPWKWKNLGVTVFHREKAKKSAKKAQNLWVHIPRSHLVFSEFNFVHYCGRRDHFSKGDHSKNAKGPQVHLYFFCRHYCISQLLHLASLSITGPRCSLDSSMLARLFEDIWRYKQRLFIASNIYLAIYFR